MNIYCEVCGSVSAQVKNPRKTISHAHRKQKNMIRCCGCSRIKDAKAQYSAYTGEKLSNKCR